VAKYLVLFSLTGETIKRFLDRPSDRAAVVRDLAESVGGSLESYYWMFGQYDGSAVFVLPDSHTMAALSLAATSSGAFTRFETHELITPGATTEPACMNSRLARRFECTDLPRRARCAGGSGQGLQCSALVMLSLIPDGRGRARRHPNRGQWCGEAAEAYGRPGLSWGVSCSMSYRARSSPIASSSGPVVVATSSASSLW
jgi:uncharacterized protein with GYD domain